MAEMGQEDQFRPPSLSGRCAFAEETFARTHRKEEDAPITVIGYRPLQTPWEWSLAVKRVYRDAPAEVIADMDLPETRYAKSGDVNIAYQVSGSRPFDL